MSTVHYFGIRHHGPGSARSLVHALTALDPDAILLEGPPEANDLLSLAAHTELAPPVALLIYEPKSPTTGSTPHAAIYPFAHYSPEWQAIQFALRRGRTVRFIDLPQAQRVPEAHEESGDDPQDTDSDASEDPLTPMAQAAGYNDVERWWDHLVESRSGQDLEVFAAVHTMMTELRAQRPTSPSLLEARREAHMRQGIRAASAAGFANIAVVCGAWHTPGLVLTVSAKADAALLKGGARTKMAAAWVPWSYERMSYTAGYGAGVESPLWYELLWDKRDADNAGLGAEWLTRAARLLRAADVPVSSAHVIEACRLAETLAALRERPVPGLPEYDDAAAAVLGGGDAANLERVRDLWYCGDRLGVVPSTFPSTPLQQDLAALTKRLRLPMQTEPKELDLDLRENNDRARSVLLRRLRILGIPWGETLADGGGDRGTFHERWQIAWQPEFSLALIEANTHGHTIEQAAAVSIMMRSDSDLPLEELVALLDEVLFADLASAMDVLLAAIERRTAVGTAVSQLLDALPPLVGVLRYGNVRATNLSLVRQIVHSLIPRICIAVPGAARHIDETAAQTLRMQLTAAERALGVLANEELSAIWLEMLAQLAVSRNAQPLLAGFANRLLYDASVIELDALAAAFQAALSLGNEPMIAASWVEGLLSGSGTVLVHDDRLRSLLEQWVSSVREEHFLQILPLVRRAFAQFPAPVRRQIGLRLRATPVTAALPTSFDRAAAQAVIPVLQRIWQSKSPTT